MQGLNKAQSAIKGTLFIFFVLFVLLVNTIIYIFLSYIDPLIMSNKYLAEMHEGKKNQLGMIAF